MTPTHRAIALGSVARLEELIARHIDPDDLERIDWRRVRTDLGRRQTHTRAIRELVEARA